MSKKNINDIKMRYYTDTEKNNIITMFQKQVDKLTIKEEVQLNKIKAITEQSANSDDLKTKKLLLNENKKLSNIQYKKEVLNKEIYIFQTRENIIKDSVYSRVKEYFARKLRMIKPREVKYYDEDEKAKLLTKNEFKKEKLSLKDIQYNEKLMELYDNPKSATSYRVQKKIVKLSTKITSVKIRIKTIEKENVGLASDDKIVKNSWYVNVKKWFSGIKYNDQVKIWGIIFIIPWVVGMLLFFLPSLFQTFYWSFNSVSISQGITSTKFVGLQNFINLFTSHVIDNSNVFSVSLLTFIKELIIDLPIIIIFSILIAVLLNKDFKGHKVIKAIFFVPVIYNLAVITETLTGNYGSFISGSMDENMLFVNQITGFFREIGLAESLMDVVLSAIDRIFTIVNLSGIQILIFIAAIQSIPNHLYEAAEIEGASKYETFWKITIPMIMPMILTAGVFTVVESFTRAPIFRFLDYAIADGNYGLASAISFSYFLINLAIIGLIFLLFRGKVFYYDDKK